MRVQAHRNEEQQLMFYFQITNSIKQFQNSSEKSPPNNERKQKVAY